MATSSAPLTLGSMEVLHDLLASMSDADAFHWVWEQLRIMSETRINPTDLESFLRQSPLVRLALSFTTTSVEGRQEVVLKACRGFVALETTDRGNFVTMLLGLGKNVKMASDMLHKTNMSTSLAPEEIFPMLDQAGQLLGVDSFEPHQAEGLAILYRSVYDSATTWTTSDGGSSHYHDSGAESTPSAAGEKAVAADTDDVVAPPSSLSSILPLPSSMCPLLPAISIIGAAVKRLPQHELTGLIPAVRYATLEPGFLRDVEVLTELVVGLDEASRIEILSLAASRGLLGGQQVDLARKALLSDGYVDQLSFMLRSIRMASGYWWYIIVLVVGEFVLSLSLNACAMPVRGWLIADAIMWLLTVCALYLFVWIVVNIHREALEQEESCLERSRKKRIVSADFDDGTGTAAPKNETSPEHGTSKSSLIPHISLSTQIQAVVLAAIFAVSLVAGSLASIVVAVELILSVVFFNCDPITWVVCFAGALVRLGFVATVAFAAVHVWCEMQASSKSEASGCASGGGSSAGATLVGDRKPVLYGTCDARASV
eukprot:TRINITY_DN49015_c0_g1_i1.p1 TRINITY_DN49015_c0_g1~~TRINITY_DN49015_c0_g1_i1.p1  ORF type:complete len:543 (+),score=93.61 TRINITY_DN49015_c0_g1_i1:64-1692(+)